MAEASWRAETRSPGHSRRSSESSSQTTRACRTRSCASCLASAVPPRCRSRGRSTCVDDSDQTGSSRGSARGRPAQILRPNMSSSEMIGASHVFLSGNECGHHVRIDQRRGEAETYPAKYPDIMPRYLAPDAPHTAAQGAHPEQSRQVSRQNGGIPGAHLFDGRSPDCNPDKVSGYGAATAMWRGIPPSTSTTWPDSGLVCGRT